MPWNAYGVWWSRYWAYNETGIRAVVEGYESHNLPLNYLVRRTIIGYLGCIHSTCASTCAFDLCQL